MSNLQFLLVVIVYLFENVNSETTKIVPDLLRPCYENNVNEGPKPPLSMPVLIELIRKVELDEKNAMNMRLLSSALLHGVLKDGIRKQSVLNDIGVPYAATGPEFYKYQLVTEYLTQEAYFPNDTLSTSELCFLHKMISNTIDPSDADNACTFKKTIPLEFEEPDEGGTYCLRKKGTVKTNWGPVSPSHLVMGIAAALEESDVSFQRLQLNFARRTHGYRAITDKISLWVTTLAADLAQVILGQMKYDLKLGNEGVWNDTILPRAFYLKSNISDLTEDEILGGIDATIIGLNIQQWLKQISSLRLSQVLDMYYSNRGIFYDTTLQAGNRSSTLNYLKGLVNLQNQVCGATWLLFGVGLDSIGSPTEQDIINLAEAAVQKFGEKTDEILRKYDSIESITNNDLNAPVELIVILDNSYDTYSAQRFLNSLSETLQMSYYGSRIGVINGETGDWISNVTSEIYELFKGVYDNQKKWPARLNIEKSLKTAIAFYQNKTDSNCTITLKPMAKSIIIFSEDGRVTELDKTATQTSISAIKNAYPESNIMYITPDENGFFKELSVKYKNDSVINLSSDVSALVADIFSKLKNVPASIVNFYCDENIVKFEDYITPNIESFYEIHEEYIRRTHFATKFTNYYHGIVNICYSGSANGYNRICTALGYDDEMVFNSNGICLEDTACNVKFFVNSNETAIKCTDSDCRFPDQVRIRITYTFSGAPWIHGSILLILISCIVNNVI